MKVKLTKFASADDPKFLLLRRKTLRMDKKMMGFLFQLIIGL